MDVPFRTVRSCVRPNDMPIRNRDDPTVEVPKVAPTALWVSPAGLALAIRESSYQE